jgi:serine/threonine-protein kinase
MIPGNPLIQGADPMVARTYPCDINRLKSFLDDDLPEREHAQLNDHLETCVDCQRRLERLAGGSGLWRELRQLSPRLGSAQGTGYSTPDTDLFGTDGRSEPAWARDHSLDFLGTSDDPASLGRLGPYEVTELLGRGGFGVVLKAFDPMLGRAVAIKVLAPQLASSAAARGRFAREARAAAAVVHDHVVAIHAVDSWNRLPYLVMPYIAGQSLQERVDRDGPLDLKEVLRISIQTAQGLESAHAQGLVHRDVKPSNILLKNGVERVKLTDFGLARAVDDASLTQSGVVAGTPQYMSPEQARGEPVDHRSDLFSLGSVMYFMCAGHAPFRASSTPAVLRRVSDEQPRPVREIHPEVPAWLAEIIECLHAKNAGERFESAGEVAELLERNLAAVQRGLPIAVAARKPIAKNGRPGRMAALAGVLSIAGFALALAAYYRKDGNMEDLFPTLRHGSGNSQAIAIGDDQEERQIVIHDSSPIVGSGKTAVKNWDIAGFNRVQIGTTFRVKIAKGKDFKVTTTAEDNVLPFVKVEKEGQSLKIGLEKGHSFSLKKPLEAEIVLPTLAELELTGSSEASLAGFDSEKDVVIEISNSSELNGSMVAETAKLKLDGASRLSLTGSAGSAQLSAGGASRLSLREFALKKCELRLEGASRAEITVRSTAPLFAKVSDASTLKGSVEASTINLDLDGGSNATLTGTGDSAVLVASHASQLELGECKSKTVDVTLSEASGAKVAVSGSLKYRLSSASHLSLRGKPASIIGESTDASHVSHE